MRIFQPTIMASKSSPTSVLPRRSKRSASSSLFVAAAALTSSSSALPIKKPRTSSSKTTKRTQSFTALYPECFPHLDVKPHTLIVGTHPSISSLSQQQYFAHPMKYVLALSWLCSHSRLQRLLVDRGGLSRISS